MAATRAIEGLREVADLFDVAVLDQWGVLHDGARSYPSAPPALRHLHENGKRIVVLSNSGKRSELNLRRIASHGLPVENIEIVMTSGEALRRDVEAGELQPFARPFVLAGAEGDFGAWSDGLAIETAASVEEADSLLLMGLPEGAALSGYDPLLEAALERGLVLVCSNPDRGSPRPGGAVALQPGAVAAAYEQRGGTVAWYGKPYGPIFEAVERFCGVRRDRLLMIGDSPEHDIAGGARAGWQTCLVRGGLHARVLRPGTDAQVERLSAQHDAPLPDFHLDTLAW